MEMEVAAGSPCRVHVLSESASSEEKKNANKNWPPVLDAQFIVYDDGIEVKMIAKAVFNPRRQVIIQCCEESCTNPNFGTATTSSLHHASRHVTRAHVAAQVAAQKSQAARDLKRQKTETR